MSGWEKGHIFGWRGADGIGSLRGGRGKVLGDSKVMRHGLLLRLRLVLVLVLIGGVVGRIQGKGWVDLGGTRRGHVGLWNAVVLMVHGHDEVEPVRGVLRVTRGGRHAGREDHF